MKIEHITADNFLRLNLFDVDMTDAAVHLFSGCNEAGKTSVQEAIRFCLLGETARVGKTAAERKLLIRDGAKKGAVSVTIDGMTFTRDIKSGVMDAPDCFAFTEFLPFVLDAQRFANLKEGDRRNFLIELTNTKVDPENIANRMKVKGVHSKCIEVVKPMLHGSLADAYDYACKERPKAKSMWEGLTGTKYGSQIAASWKPTIPADFNQAAYNDLRGRVDALSLAEGKLQEQKGGLDQRLMAARIIFGKQDAEVFSPDKLDEAQTRLELAEKWEAEQTKKYEMLNTDISNGKEKAPVTCCECGALLRVSFYPVPDRGMQANVSLHKPLDAERIQQLQSELMICSEQITAAKNQQKIAREDIARMERLKSATLSGERITQEQITGLENLMGKNLEALQAAAVERAQAQEQLSKMQAAATLAETAAEVEERAQSLHRAAQAWEKCVEALAPDGIPAEILSDTLRPINQRLRDTSVATGWSQVSISPTMEILSDGRRYGLLSESARWRADVAIAEAISHLAELGLLVIDRFDVLDLPSRAQFMRWISKIASDYHTIMLFGTLKELPKLPDSMRAHWLIAGEIAC